MRKRAVPMGALSYCILIKGHGRRGDVRGVQRTFAGMVSRRVEVDLATLNALLDAFARNGELAGAEDVLCEMARFGVTPSAR